MCSMYKAEQKFILFGFLLLSGQIPFVKIKVSLGTSCFPSMIAFEYKH